MSDRTDEIRAFLARAQAARRVGAGASGSVATAAVVAIPRPDAAPEVGHWDCAQLSGRLVELSGVGAVASLTAAVGLVLDAQRRGDPVAWVTLPESTFYPPDVADSGVDLDALIVIRVPIPTRRAPTLPSPLDGWRDRRRAPSTLSVSPDERAALHAVACEAAARAADRLVRSGGFGLVVLDLGKDAEVSAGLQGRLAGLAQRHDSAIVCITEKPPEAASLGSMVSLRAEAMRRVERAVGVAGAGAAGTGPGLTAERFACQVRVLKDKRRAPSWSHAEVVRAPAGLR